ncbi:hypothetical protein VTN96DRAFT_2179 [Rasamsonia emersonii]
MSIGNNDVDIICIPSRAEKAACDSANECVWTLYMGPDWACRTPHSEGDKPLCVEDHHSGIFSFLSFSCVERRREMILTLLFMAQSSSPAAAVWGRGALMGSLASLRKHGRTDIDEEITQG